MLPVRIGALPAFIVLYATMYVAFGVASPFLPRFFESRGLTPEQLGLLLALGMMIRLVAGPFAGRLADQLGALRAVLATCAASAAAMALGLLTVEGFLLLVIVHMGHAAALAHWPMHSRSIPEPGPRPGRDSSTAGCAARPRPRLSSARSLPARCWSRLN